MHFPVWELQWVNVQWYFFRSMGEMLSRSSPGTNNDSCVTAGIKPTSALCKFITRHNQLWLLPYRRQYHDVWNHFERSQSRGRHGNGNRGYRSNNRGNNCGDGDRSRKQSGNTAVMGFRIIGNTAGIKLVHATDVATGEALPNKTASSSSKVIDRDPRSWDVTESMTRLDRSTYWHLSTTESCKCRHFIRATQQMLYIVVVFIYTLFHHRDGSK